MKPVIKILYKLKSLGYTIEAAEDLLSIVNSREELKELLKFLGLPIISECSMNRVLFIFRDSMIDSELYGDLSKGVSA